jgi:hypothetical protein
MGAKLTYSKPWHSDGPPSSRAFINDDVAATCDKTYEYTTDDEAPGNSTVHNVFNVSMAAILCQPEVQRAKATHTER